MEVTINEVSNVIQSYYNEKYPEFILTKRIMDNLILIVHKGLSNASDSMKMSQAYSSIYDFLEKDNILDCQKPSTIYFAYSKSSN